MAWFILFIAGLLEMVWALLLKQSEGFSRPLPTIGFVVSLNLKRRHLTESQRAMVAAKLANLTEGRPKKDEGAPLIGETAQISAVSQSDAARALNVSRGSVQNAVAVQRDAIPEVQKAVEARTWETHRSRD